MNATKQYREIEKVSVFSLLVNLNRAIIGRNILKGRDRWKRERERERKKEGHF